ncbi:vWA domain-containing protein [Clostridium tertium]|uniref:vWA domain-containing protein n=1 Tax=Clostridium tertium TaxID=1559 RepID=UPI00241DD270|nr:VWA domain-containing protein [Clostridium tertium]
MVSKRKFKIISIITSLFVISTLISLKSLNAKANDVASKPNFKITELNATPNPAKVGEDILVSGKIVPEDFETAVQPKEIVLVLDTSGSMSEEIASNKKCTEQKIFNYCIKHNKFGDHYETSTRIAELKKAAKSFIDTMKDVPNLKIGIIKYASDATIVSDLKSANDLSLTTAINGLNANGGTNIREGLRKATYLLNKGNSNANKTVVLMTDGNPTYYSKYDQLDDTDPTPYGTGNSTTSETMTYTKNLAKDQIGSRQYNAYSIGYGLDTSGSTYLKQIHAAMKNLSTNTDLSEKDGFFSKSDGSITEIFNQIAENIKNSYELKEVCLDIDFNQSFKLNIGGSVIKVGNILYERTSNDEYTRKTGKVIYHAEPVNFSFMVKGSQVGQLQSILDNIDINFLFEKENITVSSNVDVKVDIISNELPNISARLISGDKLEIKKDEEITLKYEINPQDFVYNNANNSGKMDVVIVAEYGFKNQNTFTDIKNAIWNKLITKFPNDGKVRYSLILFNNKGENSIFSLKDFSNVADYHGAIQPKISNLENGNYSDSNSKEIYGALNKAYEELSKNSRADANKNLIIVSNNDINYNKKNNDYESLFSKIKLSEYNIISLSIESQEKSSNLYKVHTDLGEDDNSIIYNNNIDNGINNKTMDLVREKLIAYSAAKPYEFKPVINLKLGSNFEPVSGIARSTEIGKQNLGIVEVPTITYNLTQNNNYHAEGKVVEIRLRANNLTSGTYTFGKQSDNIMAYKSILGNHITANIATPIIVVKEEVKNVTHGLYNGIISNEATGKKEISIQEKNAGKSFEMTQGSTVTFGSQFTLSGNSVDFNLNIDNKFNTVSTNDIKLYKVLKDSSGNSILTEITNGNRATESQGDNNFKISINNIKESNQTSESDILVVYQARVKDELSTAQSLTNEIKFSNLSKSVTIITTQASDKSPSLPDLF